MSEDVSNMSVLRGEIESLEVKLAYQEDTIEMLNQTVIQQQNRLKNIEQLLEKITEKLKSMPASESQINDQVELPPHY